MSTSSKPVFFDQDGQPIINPTNEDFISWIMNVSPYGAMAQLVVVEAVRYYTEQVSLQAEPEDEPNALINPKAWQACCKDIHNKVVANYEGR